MSEYTYTNLKVVGKHEPEHSTELDAYGNKEQVELPGFITIGVELEGVFVPLVQRKAAGLLADIERAKSKSASKSSSSG